MYHSLIFLRLLDAIFLIELNPNWKSNNFKFFLVEKASRMQSWLKNMIYSTGQIPLVNDSTYEIAPNPKELFEYSFSLGIENKLIPLSESGYRKFKIKL